MYKESIGEPIPSKWKIYQLGGELKEQRDELLNENKVLGIRCVVLEQSNKDLEAIVKELETERQRLSK